MVTFEIQKGYFKVWDGKTAYNAFILEGGNKESHSYLPDLDIIYGYCIAHHYEPEKTIDLMLQIYHVDRLFKSGYLQDLSLVTAFIGPRGSGKSVGATAYAVIDYLLAGKPVWSNMPIELKVKYRDCEKIFRSEPLDKAALMDINEFESQFADGLILIDEMNIEIADSRRSMSNTMLWFDMMLQEVRKRKMNICYMLQAEEWAGSRSRWQTDIYVVCRDRAFLDGHPTKDKIGRRSRWRLHDMSGIITGDIKFMAGFDRNKVDYFEEITFWNVPFWGVYQTHQMQAYEKFDPSKKNDRKLVIDTETLNRLTAGYQVLPEMIVNLLDSVGGRILRSEVWELLKVDDQAERTKIGSLLHDLGVDDYRDTYGNRGYILPAKEILTEKLAKLGVKIA